MTFAAALLLSVLVLIQLTLLNMVSICRPLGDARRLALAIAESDTTRAPSRGQIDRGDRWPGMVKCDMSMPLPP